MRYRLISDLEVQPYVDLHDRGLHYGDGLFETMLLHNGEIKYWPEHYERLSNSANKLKMRCPERDWFEKQLQPYIDLNQRLIIKIILTRGSGGRGLNLPDNLPNNIYLLRYIDSNSYKNQSIKAIFSEITLPSNLNLAGLKHLNRLDYVLATDELATKNEFNEALLFDINGFIIEGIVNNLFFTRDGEIYTPDLHSSGVDGVMRQLILKNLKQNAKEVKIGNYSKQDIITADECFLCNSVQGIRPVIQIENIKFTIGPITQNLQKIFHGHAGN